MLFYIMIIAGCFAVYGVWRSAFRKRMKACTRCKAEGKLRRPPRAYPDQPHEKWICDGCGAELDNDGKELVF